MDISIRHAQEKDLPALDELKAVCGIHKEGGYFARCLKEQAEGRRLVFMADGNDGAIGYGMFNWYPRYALYRKLGIPEIQDLNIVPAARRQGAATALIAHCESAAREQGCDHIGISVPLHADYGPAQRLYARLGYLPDGYGVTYDRAPVRPGEIRPVDDNLCLMLVKPLGPA